MSIFRASFGVFDGSGSQIATVKTKQSAVAMARVVGGSVRKGGKLIYSAARNPVKKTKKKSKSKRNAKTFRTLESAIRSLMRMSIPDDRLVSFKFHPPLGHPGSAHAMRSIRLNKKDARNWYPKWTSGKNPRKKSSARPKVNPGKALKSKIGQMKPRTWYSTTLSGAKVKVKRAGQSLIVKPATKRRKR